MDYIVYILRSKIDSRLYIGQTRDLQERLVRHNGRREKSTRAHAPYEIVYTEVYQTRSEAVQRERKIKSYKGGEALKKLLLKSSARDSESQI